MAFGIKGTRGDDDLTGSNVHDLFQLGQGGEDTAHGEEGNDTFLMARTLDAGDSIDGGDGRDTVILAGAYPGGLTLGADTLTSIEVLRFAGQHDYDVTLDDGNLAAHKRLVVNAHSLPPGHDVTVDGSAETDGRFRFFASAGDDTLTGGAKGDVFFLANGGNDSADGGGGNDTFYLGDSLTPGDAIDGGGGNNDQVWLDGDYSTGLPFGPDTIKNVEVLQLAPGHGYDLTMDDGNLAAGQTMLINGGELSDPLNFNGGAESSGSYHIVGSVVADSIFAGQGDDLIVGSSGPDTLYGSDGSDTFHYFAANNSPANTFTNVDYLGDFVAADDFIELPFTATYVGTVSGSANDFSDLQTLLDASFAGGSYNAVLYQNTAGALGGATYLFVDFDNSGTYNGASDLAIDITSMTDPRNFGQGNFLTY